MNRIQEGSKDEKPCQNNVEKHLEHRDGDDGILNQVQLILPTVLAVRAQADFRSLIVVLSDWSVY